VKLNLTLEQVKEIAASGEYDIIPVSAKMYSDSTTPTEVVRILKRVSRHVFLLESAEADKRWGRYSFIGYDPVLELNCTDGEVKLTTPMTKQAYKGNPREVVRQVLWENRSPRLEELPPFTGGLVGYFSYDYIKYSEPTLKLDARDEEGFQDVDLMLFHKVIVFDNYRQKIILIVNARTEDMETYYNKAVMELEQMRELILKGQKEEPVPFHLKSDFRPLFDEKAYCHMVERAKEYIREGDIFQVVLSNRLEADMEGSLMDAYRVLRTTNPSPYMFYFSGKDGEIAGASPETLAKLEKGKLYTFPLAGTRKRGATPAQDQELEDSLLKDEKELAEHNMLVDLGRNDIGRISRLGTVKVEKYMSIEKFSHVMHIGSTVSGQIREDKDAVDAVDAILPAGTLSGAPKLRACEIIREKKAQHFCEFIVTGNATKISSSSPVTIWQRSLAAAGAVGSNAGWMSFRNPADYISYGYPWANLSTENLYFEGKTVNKNGYSVQKFLDAGLKLSVYNADLDVDMDYYLAYKDKLYAICTNYPRKLLGKWN